MTNLLGGLNPSQQAQLRLLCWVACVDGVFADEERELLGRLAARLLPDVDPAEALNALLSENDADFEQLVALISTHDQRLQLVKLAYQMASSSCNAGDEGFFNSAERIAYRRLIDALALPEEEVNAAEWAGRRALSDKPGLLDRLNQILFGLVAGPSQESP